MRPITTSLAVVIIVAIAFALVAGTLIHAHSFPNEFASKVFELTYGFLLTVVIGGVVSIIFKEFSDERDRIQERRVLLRQMHSELLGAYNTAKRVRRTLRAHIGYSSNPVLAKEFTCKADDYAKQIDLLMDAQLSFEVYAKRALDLLFFKHGEVLAKNLKAIEGYLNCIIDEFEKNLACFKGVPPSMRLGDLPRLAEFLSSAESAADFKTKFKHPMRAVLSALTESALL